MTKRFLLGAVWAAVLVPLLFYLRFGEVPSLGWGLTVFLVVLCILVAVGAHFQDKREFHTPVALTGGLSDSLGAFWLAACAFGPLLGWFITLSMFPLNLFTWRWVYLARVFLAAGLPVITALPLLRYVRGRSAWVSGPILLFVTLLPALTCLNTVRDLREGPSAAEIQVFEAANGNLTCDWVSRVPPSFPCMVSNPAIPGKAYTVSYLPHTQRMLDGFD